MAGFQVTSDREADDRTVRLEVLDDAHAVLRTLEGVGRDSGGCCPAVHLHVDDDGTGLENGYGPA